MTEELVTLVDQTGHPHGQCEKLAAHREGLLHSAISVFLFDKAGRMLLQRRAAHKYHCGGQWANTCCGHPRPGEAPLTAANRRLWEELGIKASISQIGRFTYSAPVGGELTENEYVHLFAGTFEGDMNLNKDEVSEVAFIRPDRVRSDSRTADKLTPWFELYLDEAVARLPRVS